MKNILSGSLLISAMLLATQSQAECMRNERCLPVNDQQIEGLFDRWNSSLATGNPLAVVKNYAKNPLLLATVSNVPRGTPEEKVDYFTEFLKKKSKGVIDFRQINKDCNTAVDAGTYAFNLNGDKKVPARYTFTYKYFGNKLGWFITIHHSSMMPEK